LRIFVNGRFGSQPVTGVQRYAGELLRALDRELDRGTGELAQFSFQLLAPVGATRLPPLEHIAVRHVGRLSGHRWEQVELPWFARGGLLANLANTGPLLHRSQVVTIHDASAFAIPEAYSPAFRRWYRFLLPALGKVARRVVTDSEFSKAELMRYARIPGEKLRVIPLSGEHIRSVEADRRILDRWSLRPHSYLLTVGSHSPHKNLAVVAEAVERLGSREFDVVVAGGLNPRVFRTNPIRWGPGVKLTGYVSEGELRALYENAGCFVYPSLYEGFGLPPLEAMSCGCPVIVSQAASLPEVCGSAAVYMDPRAAGSVSSSIIRVMHDPELQERLRGLGRRRAPEFTWARSATALMQVLHELVPR
jgi:glycosyltransferase involved in cell wall biosynthesis